MLACCHGFIYVHSIERSIQAQDYITICFVCMLQHCRKNLNKFCNIWVEHCGIDEGRDGEKEQVERKSISIITVCSIKIILINIAARLVRLVASSSKCSKSNSTVSASVSVTGHLVISRCCHFLLHWTKNNYRKKS